MNDWPFPPAAIPPLGGTVHIWMVELDVSGFDPSVWSGRLSPDEQGRAARFKFDRDRKRYVVAHAALRDILASYANADAVQLQFIAGPHGKPELAGSRGLEFNLSHSHERALVGVNQGSKIGIDIEFVKADFDFHEVANQFFTNREVGALRELAPALQRQGFYKCWTSKEAFLKAKGTGLAGELDEVEITLARDRHVRVNAHVPGWSLEELDPGNEYEAALVVASRPIEILCYRWQPGGN